MPRGALQIPTTRETSRRCPSICGARCPVQSIHPLTGPHVVGSRVVKPSRSPPAPAGPTYTEREILARALTPLFIVIVFV